jgi:hypothetical protein
MKVRIFVRTINGFIFKYLNKYVRGNCLKQFYLVLYDLKDYTYLEKQTIYNTRTKPNLPKPNLRKLILNMER